MQQKLFSKIKPLFYYLWFIAVAAGIMVSLLYAVYSIPVEKIREKAVKSADIIGMEAEHPRALIKFPGMYFDTWTDSKMLNMASFLGQSGAPKDSLLTPRVDCAFFPYICLAMAVKKNSYSKESVVYYAKFWQGWLVFVKPLLVFFDLGQIRIFNCILQLSLLMFILFMMYRRLGIKYCIAFITAVCFLNPYTSWRCLEFATDVNIMLMAVLWVLLNKNPKDNYMFFVIGAVTIAFDWLTYPLITLGMPLITYILLYDRDFKDSVKCVIKNSLLWGAGYILMWLSKWGIATLLTDENVFEIGYFSIRHSSYGNIPGDVYPASFITYGHALIFNFKELCCWGSLIYLIAFLLVLGCICGIRLFKFFKNLKVVILLGISLMPFVWYAVLVNHSIHHSWMTYKILTITIYALLSAIVCSLKPKIKN